MSTSKRLLYTAMLNEIDSLRGTIQRLKEEAAGLQSSTSMPSTPGPNSVSFLNSTATASFRTTITSSYGSLPSTGSMALQNWVDSVAPGESMDDEEDQQNSEEEINESTEHILPLSNSSYDSPPTFLAKYHSSTSSSLSGYLKPQASSTSLVRFVVSVSIAVL
jgi:hypothetical protein